MTMSKYYTSTGLPALEADLRGPSGESVYFMPDEKKRGHEQRSQYVGGQFKSLFQSSGSFISEQSIHLRTPSDVLPESLDEEASYEGGPRGIS